MHLCETEVGVASVVRRRVDRESRPAKRASGLFTVLRWLRGAGADAHSSCDSDAESLPDSYAPALSRSSSSSSRDTAASFSFVPADEWTTTTTGGERASVYVEAGPLTHTYLARLADRERRIAADGEVTLRTKYRLPGGRVSTHSLPPGGRILNRHRRTASEPLAERRPRAHVPGKRRAPPPPDHTGTNPTMRRKKRLAPQPPITTTPTHDTLRLEGGMLKPAREELPPGNKPAAVSSPPPAPRPWYKRSTSANATHKQTTQADNRRSACNMSFLTNISELDRQTAEILERQTLKMRYLQRAPDFMRPKQPEQQPNNLQPTVNRPRTARDLIARFNAITGSSGSSVTEPSSPSFQSPSAGGSAPGSPGPALRGRSTSRSPWTCPRCRLDNDYWRIICRVCSAIKPYFDDFTVEGAVEQGEIVQGSAVTSNELNFFGKQIFEKLPVNSNDAGKSTSANPLAKSASQSAVMAGPKSPKSKSKLQSSILDNILKDIRNREREHSQPEIKLSRGFESPKSIFRTNKENNTKDKQKIEKMILGDEINVEKPSYMNNTNTQNTENPTEPKKIVEKISFGNQITPKTKEEPLVNGKSEEDREALKKMLIEMKNSLSKRSINSRRSSEEKRVSIVQEEVEKPTLITVTKETTYENIRIKRESGGGPLKVSSGAQTEAVRKRAIGARERAQVEGVMQGEGSDAHTYSNGSGDGGVLARELQAAIASGEHGKAADLATRLALLRLPCTVLPGQLNEQATDDMIELRVYVEDRWATSGPHSLRASPAWTLARLRAQAETLLHVPQRAQRWILGDRLAQDEHVTLREYQVIDNGSTVYLYILNKNEEGENEGAASNNAEAHNVTITELSDDEEEGAIALTPSNSWKCAVCKQENSSETCIICGSRRVLNLTPPPNGRVPKQNTNLYKSGSNDTPLLSRVQAPPTNGTVVESISHQATPTFSVTNNKASTPSTYIPYTSYVANSAISSTTTIGQDRVTPTSSTTIVLPKVEPTSSPTTVFNSTALAYAVSTTPCVINGATTVPTSQSANNIVPSTVQSTFVLPTTSSAKTTILNPTKSDRITSFEPNTVNIVPSASKTEVTTVFTTKLNNTAIKNDFITSNVKTTVISTTTTVPNSIKNDFAVPNYSAATTVLPKEQFIVPVTKTTVFSTNISTTTVPSTTKNELPNTSNSAGTTVIPTAKQITVPVTKATVHTPSTSISVVPINPVSPTASNSATVPAFETVEPVNEDTYRRLVQMDGEELIANAESFECLVCMEKCEKGEGAVLRECLHQFCRDCLVAAVDASETAEIACPYRDAKYACAERLQEREVRALVTREQYERHLWRSVREAERALGERAYHCRTRDCPGWCVYEDLVNAWRCEVCNRMNCLTCQAVHEGRDCRAYQQELTAGGDQSGDEEGRTRDWLQKALASGEAMTCPTCKLTLMKKWGCDWLRCSVCKTEICWVTRGPRWGPKGKGDTSAGCRCGVGGVKCHPNCNYCH